MHLTLSSPEPTALAARTRFRQGHFIKKAAALTALFCRVHITTLPVLTTALRHNHGTSYDASMARNTYGYDNLNRLSTQNGTTIATYATNGNITSKVDVTGQNSGAYTYNATKPHAVETAWGYSMTYDASGNLATRQGNGNTWTTRWAGYDKPRWLAKTNAQNQTTGSEFTYNANRSRILHLEFDQMANSIPTHYTRKKVYAAGPDLELDYLNTAATGNAPTWKQDTIRVYVTAPGGTAGTMEYKVSTATQPEKALVYHTDHLGSIESITLWGDTSATWAPDETGKPSRYSYDAWGERRNPDTWNGKPTTTTQGGHDDLATRGYTGHEMLDSLGLIHMNGRIYDPLLGRMLSADLVVQYEGDLQSFNRYSYVRNNPLTLIDPSGFLDETAFAKQLINDGDAGRLFLAEMESYSAAGQKYKSFESYNAPASVNGDVGGVTDDVNKVVYVQDKGDMQATVDHTVHETGHVPQKTASTVGEYRANEHGAYGKEGQYQIDAKRPGDLAKKEKVKDPASQKNVTVYRINTAAIDARLDDAYKLKGIDPKTKLVSSASKESDFSKIENINVGMVRLAYDAAAAKTAAKAADKAATNAEKAAKKAPADKKAEAQQQAKDAREAANKAAETAKAAQQAADDERKRLKKERGY